eukprot:g1454.t1
MRKPLRESIAKATLIGQVLLEDDPGKEGRQTADHLYSAEDNHEIEPSKRAAPSVLRDFQKHLARCGIGSEMATLLFEPLESTLIRRPEQGEGAQSLYRENKAMYYALTRKRMIADTLEDWTKHDDDNDGSGHLGEEHPVIQPDRASNLRRQAGQRIAMINEHEEQKTRAEIIGRSEGRLREVLPRGPKRKGHASHVKKIHCEPCGLNFTSRAGAMIEHLKAHDEDDYIFIYKLKAPKKPWQDKQEVRNEYRPEQHLYRNGKHAAGSDTVLWNIVTPASALHNKRGGGTQLRCRKCKRNLLDAKEIRVLFRRTQDAVWHARHAANTDESVYTGGPGVSIALALTSAAPECAHWFLQATQDRQDLWSRRTARPRHRELKTSLMCGYTGSVMSHLYQALAEMQDSAVLGSTASAQLPRGRAESSRGDSFAPASPMRLSEAALGAINALIDVAENDAEVCDADEWLYGRGGHLTALLLVADLVAPARPRGSSELSDSSDTQEQLHARIASCVKKVAKQMLVSGRRLSQHLRRDPPLSYRWCDENYLGAAHGLCGILYVLLCTYRKGYLHSADDLADVERSLNWLLDTCKIGSTGNYPPTWDQELFSPKNRSPTNQRRQNAETEDGHLVHFCHGAPGFVYLLIEAHRRFGHKTSRYLEEALSLGTFIFRYGVLNKGVGLCHGTAGNGFCFLALHRFCQGEDARWLKYARVYCGKVKAWVNRNQALEKDAADWCDHPWSLYEGLAGTMVFLQAVLMALQREDEAMLKRGSSAAPGLVRALSGNANVNPLDVKLGKEIGHGSFGIVFVGRDGASGKLIAVKEILFPTGPSSTASGAPSSRQANTSNSKSRTVDDGDAQQRPQEAGTSTVVAMDDVKLEEQSCDIHEGQEEAPTPAQNEAKAREAVAPAIDDEVAEQTRRRDRWEATMEELTKKLFDELELLQSLAHHRIVAYLGASYTARNSLQIYMEYVSGGSLKSQLEEFGPILKETVFKSYTRQILEGVAYLHANRVVHCDLKTGNILLSDDGSVKIADFGASIKTIPRFGRGEQVETGANNQDADVNKLVGTPIIWAPEQLEKGGASFESDIWSLGCCMVEMRTSCHLWKLLKIDNPMFAYARLCLLPWNIDEVFKAMEGSMHVASLSLSPGDAGGGSPSNAEGGTEQNIHVKVVGGSSSAQAGGEAGRDQHPHEGASAAPAPLISPDGGATSGSDRQVGAQVVGRRRSLLDLDGGAALTVIGPPSPATHSRQVFAPADLSDGCRRLIAACLQKDAASRPRAEDLLRWNLTNPRLPSGRELRRAQRRTCAERLQRGLQIFVCFSEDIEADYQAFQFKTLRKHHAVFLAILWVSYGASLLTAVLLHDLPGTLIGFYVGVFLFLCVAFTCFVEVVLIPREAVGERYGDCVFLAISLLFLLHIGVSYEALKEWFHEPNWSVPVEHSSGSVGVQAIAMICLAFYIPISPPAFALLVLLLVPCYVTINFGFAEASATAIVVADVTKTAITTSSVLYQGAQLFFVGVALLGGLTIKDVHQRRRFAEQRITREMVQKLQRFEAEKKRSVFSQRKISSSLADVCVNAKSAQWAAVLEEIAHQVKDLLTILQVLHQNPMWQRLLSSCLTKVKELGAAILKSVGSGSGGNALVQVDFNASDLLVDVGVGSAVSVVHEEREFLEGEDVVGAVNYKDGGRKMVLNSTSTRQRVANPLVLCRMYDPDPVSRVPADLLYATESSLLRDRFAEAERIVAEGGGAGSKVESPTSKDTASKEVQELLTSVSSPTSFQRTVQGRQHNGAVFLAEHVLAVGVEADHRSPNFLLESAPDGAEDSSVPSRQPTAEAAERDSGRKIFCDLGCKLALAALDTTDLAPKTLWEWLAEHNESASMNELP